MAKKQVSPKTQAKKVLALLNSRYKQPKTHLIAKNAWELLVATILAAQCTDARVNTITPTLFKLWPGPKELASASQENIEKVIHSVGFYHNKAKNLLATAKKLRDEFSCEIPKTIEELTSLPGVARKTANVVLFGAFGINAGLAVDTHVKRISYRLGLTKNTDPVYIEKDLMNIFPQEEWGNINHRMVWFGRDVCMAKKPECTNCEFSEICPKLEPPKR